MDVETYKKEFRKEVAKFKGKGMDDKKVVELGERALKNMDFNQPHVLAIPPEKTAATLIILHAKDLTRGTSGNKRGGFKPKKG